MNQRIQDRTTGRVASSRASALKPRSQSQARAHSVFSSVCTALQAPGDTPSRNRQRGPCRPASRDRAPSCHVHRGHGRPVARGPCRPAGEWAPPLPAAADPNLHANSPLSAHNNAKPTFALVQNRPPRTSKDVRGCQFCGTGSITFPFTVPNNYAHRLSASQQVHAAHLHRSRCPPLQLRAQRPSRRTPAASPGSAPAPALPAPPPLCTPARWQGAQVRIAAETTGLASVRSLLPCSFGVQGERLLDPTETWNT